MPRMLVMIEREDGWCDWIHPIGHGKPKPYRMGCCDCGLVHDMQFKVQMLGKSPRIIFRARRNNRSTAAKRKKKK